MYLPKHFEEGDAAVIHGLLRAHPLACVVVPGPAGLEANHLPLLLDAGAGRLRGHVARANGLWRLAEAAGPDGLEALAIFQGADGYVTPSWYPSKQEHGKVVPTWNYEAVHVQARLRAVDDRDWLRALVTELTATFESNRPAPWQVADAPPDYVDTLLGAIVGVELTITAVTAKRKLSQNRPPADRAGVVQGLHELGGDAARAHADAIEQAATPSPSRPQ
ncbi:MAG: FMN-binding negative transcriptional regulator [Pelomonas sp.]|nr:FMN-binding negative transcriptional regulator [Roseateles sp.]